MAPESDEAIVLRLTDYSESSQIATLFTRAHGQVRLIAKGARRSTRTRIATGLDLLERGSLSYLPARGDAQLGTLAEWLQGSVYPGLRGSLAALYSGLYAAEFVTLLTQETDPHPGLFDALATTLAQLDAGDGPVGAVVHFQCELLREVGYAPNLEQCVSCGKVRSAGAGAYFSSAAGGLLCRACEPRFPEKRRITAKLLDSDPAGEQAAHWFELLDYHLTNIAGRPARTAAPLRAEWKRGRG